ncbi:MAG: glycogen synthase, partial [Burkholderiales bacterium]
MSAGVPRVLFATSECGPWLKTGGLADVAEALPPALARLGLDVRVVVPGYRRVLRETADARTVARLAPSAELPSATIREARLPSGIVALVIDAAELFDRDGGPYQDANGADWPDNALRFGLFSRAAALIAAGIAIPGWQAEVLHLNDWQTGLAAAYLHYGIAAAAGPAPRVVFTVHNLAFQGLFPHALVARLGLPAHAWSIDGVEFFGQLSCMKAGLQFADAITTVSPSYALEIRSAPLGCGLEGLLEYRAASLHGIVNGIDTSVWNPADDPFIPARYDAGHLDAKGRNKAALQARFGLAADSGALVFGFVGRFTRQKGVDLIVAAAPRLCALPAQLAILGSGEHELEAAMRELAARLPGRVAVLNAFDESLAHLIEAGADV